MARRVLSGLAVFDILDRRRMLGETSVSMPAQCGAGTWIAACICFSLIRQVLWGTYSSQFVYFQF
jgi:hypothetical protein